MSYKKIVTLNKSIVIVLTLVCIFITGCTDNNDKNGITSHGKENSSSNVQSTESSTDSQDSSDENYRTETSFTVDSSVKPKRDDADEVIAGVDSAFAAKNLAGFADKEAAALRNEILNTGNTENYYSIKGTKYYISPDGDDTLNTGTSPDSPWRTVDSLDSVTLKPGDAVLFERDSVFRITRAINAQDGVIYGSYGEGRKPCIYASPRNYAAQGVWEPTNKKNVWKTNFAYDEAGNIVFNHGEYIGYYKTGGLDFLKENTQYYHNVKDGIVYLYCDKGNPSNYYSDIEIMPGYAIFSIAAHVSNVTIDNICLKYSGVFGINGVYQNDNINITNCEIGFIGGKTVGGSVRYGNAIQLWNGCKSVKIENNWIYQTFDSAVTWQGEAGKKGIYSDVSFSGNLLEYNNSDIEFWEVEGSTVNNFTINNNIMRFTCLGWGTRLDDAGIRGIEGCIKGDTVKMSVFKSVVVENNIMDCPGKEIINWQITPDQIKQLHTSGNKAFVKGSYRKDFGNACYALRGMSLTDEKENAVKANNQNELKQIFELFDTSSTAIAKWYD